MFFEDYDILKTKLENAYIKDRESLQHIRTIVKDLAENVIEISMKNSPALAFVSSDGGLNRINFNPCILEIIRITDSLGKNHVFDIVSSSTTVGELELRIEEGPMCLEPLRLMCRDLKTDLVSISPFLRRVGDPGFIRQTMSAYRDVLEWAVLYKIIIEACVQENDMVILRDGLLRTKSIKAEHFCKLADIIRTKTENARKKGVNIYIAGMAKQNAVKEKLALALKLEGIMALPFPCYVEIPPQIEKECYSRDNGWFINYEQPGKQINSMGRLFLVKFGDNPLDPIWPLDLAEWQACEASAIMRCIGKDAKVGFPIPDFPRSLQVAHELASITDVEIDFITDLIFEVMEKEMNSKEKQAMYQYRWLNESLSSLRMGGEY